MDNSLSVDPARKQHNKHQTRVIELNLVGVTKAGWSVTLYLYVICSLLRCSDVGDVDVT